MRANI